MKKVLKAFFKNAKKSKAGFTLIELIAVIAILAILAVILIPTVGSRVNAANQAAAQSDAQAAYLAAQLYVTDTLNSGGTVADVNDSTPPEDMINSSAFDTIRGVNGFRIDRITIKNGAVISITITDNHGTATAPGASPAASSGTGSEASSETTSST